MIASGATSKQQSRPSWIKEWIACMSVFLIAQIASYEDGLYQNLEHDVVFWLIGAIALTMVGVATAIFFKKNAAR